VLGGLANRENEKEGGPVGLTLPHLSLLGRNGRLAGKRAFPGRLEKLNAITPSTRAQKRRKKPGKFRCRSAHSYSANNIMKETNGKGQKEGRSGASSQVSAVNRDDIVTTARHRGGRRRCGVLKNLYRFGLKETEGKAASSRKTGSSSKFVYYPSSTRAKERRIRGEPGKELGEKSVVRNVILTKKTN